MGFFKRCLEKPREKCAGISLVYIKSFAAFWATNILMLVSTAVIIQWFDLWSPLSPHEDHSELPNPAVRMLRQAAASLVTVDTERFQYQYNSLPDWFSRYIAILDLQDNKSYGEFSSAETELISKISRSNLFVFSEDKQLLAQQIILNDGRPLILLIRSPESYLPRIKLFIYHYWPVGLIMIFISGLLCWLIAGLMTRDIRILRNAVNQLSSGDFGASVTPLLRSSVGEIYQLGIAFDEMSNKLQHAMLEQRRLVKDVSHELRSPLARLQVALAIAQQKSDKKIHPELEKIKDASNYLGDIITGILSMPINENEEWLLDDTIDLCLLIDHLVENYREEADERGVGFDFVTNHDSVLVMTHDSTIVGVFENVIRNAVRYTDPNTNITISLTIEGRQCNVDIADRGMGVCPEKLKSIFEPFCRADEARNRDTGGFGLGLAIAKRTVRLHKGTIKASNNQHGGLTVTITLPVAPSEN